MAGTGSNFFTEATPTLKIALTDENGLATYAECVGAAPTTAGVFAHGAIIIQTDSGTGNNALFQNEGSSAVPSWQALGGGGGAPALTNSHLFVGNAGNVATDVALSGDATLANTGALTISPLAVTKGKLAAGVSAAFMCVDAARVSTGGANPQNIAIAGVVGTDLVFATMYQVGAAPVTLLTAAAFAGGIALEYSANPALDHTIQYAVFRATT